MLIYVDDIIIASSAEETTAGLLHHLQKHFAIKDLGVLNYFLGIEVVRSSRGNDGVLLTQKKHVGDLLLKANMVSCKPSATPMASTDRLSKVQGNPLTET